jgi:hypothetical protein
MMCISTIIVCIITENGEGAYPEMEPAFIMKEAKMPGVSGDEIQVRMGKSLN